MAVVAEKVPNVTHAGHRAADRQHGLNTIPAW
jgi:hypothetical protein